MKIINYMEKLDGKLVRRTLDLLIDSADSFEDLQTIKFAIDDYIEEGYNVWDYVEKYNKKIREFYAKRN